MENKKVLLSVKDLHVKFRVRGRILTAIRGISLDFYENESVAIVGESGSGKSVFTKTFAGMLETNGFIDEGSIIFNDEELADTTAPYGTAQKRIVKYAWDKLNAHSQLELGSDIFRQIKDLESEKKQRATMSAEDEEKATAAIKDLEFKRTELFNLKQTIDPKNEKARLKEVSAQIEEMDKQLQAMKKQMEATIAEHKKAVKADTAYLEEYTQKMSALKSAYEKAIKGEVSQAAIARNEIIAKEMYLSVARYGTKAYVLISKLLKAFKKAMELGVDLMDEEQRNQIFDTVVFRVKYLDETENQLHGTCVINLAKVKFNKDWTKIRGGKIATVFQDPMTSLNPIITIGKQITSVILKHQNCSEIEARARALELMKKVGIPNAENRFDDYPFQYSGGMRQRIVIAIALSCQPKILICDEPTTALDVTIQAQILRLMNDLKKERNTAILFITHDLGVINQMADDVAVMYCGQVVELAPVRYIFDDNMTKFMHPYTEGLLRSIPRLDTDSNERLDAIPGAVPHPLDLPKGCKFAPRCKYATDKCREEEPQLVQVGENQQIRCFYPEKGVRNGL